MRVASHDTTRDFDSILLALNLWDLVLQGSCTVSGDSNLWVCQEIYHRGLYDYLYYFGGSLL